MWNVESKENTDEDVKKKISSFFYSLRLQIPSVYFSSSSSSSASFFFVDRKK
jgi:hypothetical protein